MRTHSTPRLRRALAGLACLAASTGCTHNHYYSYDPCGTPTAVVPGSVRYGDVCEVPPARVIGGAPMVGGSRVAAVPSDVDSTPSGSVGTPIGARARPPKVVVSEPLGSGGGGRGGRDLTWRPSDPEGGLGRTRISGAIDDPDLTTR